jgi:hypothetical protein
MLKVFRLLWVFTAIIFFAALVLSYAFLPDRVGVLADAEGIANEFVSKEIFFYSALAIFAVVNLMGSVFLGLLTAVPFTSGFYFRSEAFKENITSWFSTFISIVNVFLITATLYVSLFNNQGDYTISDFNFLIYIAPLLLAASLFWLVIVIARR